MTKSQVAPYEYNPAQDLWERERLAPAPTPDRPAERPTSDHDAPRDLPVKSTKIHTKQQEKVLIDRRSIEIALPYAKAGLSTLCWINSILTTMLTTADIQTFVTERPSTPLAWGIGFGLAAVLTLAQIFASGRNRAGYAVALFPDALMTSYQWCQWLLLPLFIKLLPGAWSIAVFVAALAGGLIGIVSARLPERLTFGK